jgi:beta-phosphoglucomutase
MIARFTSTNNHSEMNLELHALIFDLDGVIVHTPEIHRRSWHRLAEELHVPFTEEQHYRMQGLVRRASLDVFLNGAPISDELAQQYMDRKNSFFVELLRDLKPDAVCPGIVPLISEARAAGLKVAMGSSSQNARNVLAALQLLPLFDVVADGNTVSRNKPAPDIFLWVAEQLGITPAQAAVFEDSRAGMQAALTGGFWTVGIGGEHGPGAHIAVPTLAGFTLSTLREQIQYFHEKTGK